MSKSAEIINLSFLSDSESGLILEVLKRDEHLKQIEGKRIRKLKNDLLEMRRLNRQGKKNRHPGNARICAQCQKRLGLIFDRGGLCRACNLRVCNACRVLVPGAGKIWVCSVCSKIGQLKIVTGEWFFEERGQRFKHIKYLGTDVVKISLERRVPDPPPSKEKNKHKKTEDDTDGAPSSGSEKKEKSRSKGIFKAGKNKAEDGRSLNGEGDTLSLYSVKSTSSMSRINGLFGKKKAGKAGKAGDGGNSNSDSDAQSTRSMPQSGRGSSLSLNNVERDSTSGNHNHKHSTLPANRNTAGKPQGSPALSHRSMASNYSRRENGYDSGGLAPSSDESLPEAFSKKDGKKTSGPPSISVSGASISSDRSRSEVDLSGSFSEGNEDAISVRSISMPGGLDKNLDSLDETEDEFDERMPSSHRSNTPSSMSMRSAMSMNNQTGTEKKWTRLNVPDKDADTTSLNSMVSVYSETGDYGNVNVSGEILLNINYNHKTGALNVLVKSCRELAVADEKKHRTDSYVKAYLLPDKSRQSKRKTKIKVNTLNPDFNEVLKYVISHTQLETRTLELTVWHYDRFGRNTFLGEVQISLDSWNFENREDEWFKLQPKALVSSDVIHQYKGELTICLRYVNQNLPLDQLKGKLPFRKSPKKGSSSLPSGGLLEVHIREAKNLTAVKSGGTSDTFVKGYLLPNNNKSSKNKTPVIRKTVNPVWNHTFIFGSLQHSDLQNVCLELTVWDKESLSSNVFLGGLRLGVGNGMSSGAEVDWMDSQLEERYLWQKMVDNPGETVEGTLMLRSSMGKRSL